MTILHSAVAAMICCAPALAPQQAGGQQLASMSTIEGHPLAVLLRHSVWYPAVNAPLLVLYRDGTVLYPRDRASLFPTEYYAASVGSTDPAALLKAVGVGDAFFQLDSLYDLAPNTTDLSSLLLYVWRGDSVTEVVVRAGERRGDTLATAVPTAFKSAYRAMTRFQSRAAQPWHPTELEVMFWPYEYAPDDPPVPWSSDWPTLTDSGTTHQTDDLVGDVWRLRLPFADYKALEQLLNSVREKQAIGISGHKVAARYRFLFPGEQRWRRYFVPYRG